MAWYSYLLMNAPETFILLALPFALFGISIKENLKSMIVFSLLQGLVVFILSVYFHTSIKPLITLLSFLLILFFVFRFHFLKVIIITLTTFVALVFTEVTFSLVAFSLFEINYEDVFNNPWFRILASLIFSQIPIGVITLILLKFKLKVRLPSFLN